MNIYITLDYELFFGSKSGSVDKCIIEPTEALLEIVDPYNIKLVCFVDAGYLCALEKNKESHPKLKIDYLKVTSQMNRLVSSGHSIELHIHPHWEDTVYDGKKWIFDTSRYKLADFSKTEVLEIVTKYNNILKKVTGVAPIAYRAGGWSAQPFEHIKESLIVNGVSVDSTVYSSGYYQSDNQNFDFRSVPLVPTEYKFSNDLTVPEKEGVFTEVPISSLKVSPLFYWQFALAKFQKKVKHQSYGDGGAIKMDKKQILRLMLMPSYTVVSIDGYKAKLLRKAYKKYVKLTNNSGNFVMIGHPKAFTPYSLSCLEEFIKDTHMQNEYKTFQKSEH